MSEQGTQDLTVPKQEAGWVFRTEMAITNFFLGYWRHLLAIVLLFLFAVLVYGQYQNWQTNQQMKAGRDLAAAQMELRDTLAADLDPQLRSVLRRAGWSYGTLRSVLATTSQDELQQLMMQSPEFARLYAMALSMPPEIQGVMAQSTDGVDLVLLAIGEPDDEAKAALAAGATRLEAIAQEYGGAASAQAWLEAAELHRHAGNADARRAALEQAAEGPSPYSFGASLALAHMQVDAGQVDEGIARMRQLVDTNEGLLAQQTALELGLTLEALDRDAEARELYAKFLERWPDSPMTAEIQTRRERLGEG